MPGKINHKRNYEEQDIVRLVFIFHLAIKQKTKGFISLVFLIIQENTLLLCVEDSLSK